MSHARRYRIAVIPGDGIGKEVVPERLRVLEAVAARYDCNFRLDAFDFARRSRHRGRSSAA